MKKLILFLSVVTAVLSVSCSKLGNEDIEALEEKYYGEQDLGDYTPSYCSGSYQGPSANIDIQLNTFCQAAYAYICLDGLSASSQQVTGTCAYYNQINESSTPCPYCQ
jgi:hypothetical protein